MFLKKKKFILFSLIFLIILVVSYFLIPILFHKQEISIQGVYSVLPIGKSSNQEFIVTDKTNIYKINLKNNTAKFIYKNNNNKIIKIVDYVESENKIFYLGLDTNKRINLMKNDTVVFEMQDLSNDPLIDISSGYKHNNPELAIYSATFSDKYISLSTSKEFTLFSKKGDKIYTKRFLNTEYQPYRNIEISENSTYLRTESGVYDLPSMDKVDIDGYFALFDGDKIITAIKNNRDEYCYGENATDKSECLNRIYPKKYSNYWVVSDGIYRVNFNIFDLYKEHEISVKDEFIMSEYIYGDKDYLVAFGVTKFSVFSKGELSNFDYKFILDN